MGGQSTKANSFRLRTARQNSASEWVPRNARQRARSSAVGARCRARAKARSTRAAMAVNEQGEVAGSVSGGCVEGAVVSEAGDVISDGKPRTLEDFRGKAVVLFFGYTRCPDVCPTTLADMSVAMKALGIGVMRAYGSTEHPSTTGSLPDALTPVGP